MPEERRPIPEAKEVASALKAIIGPRFAVPEWADDDDVTKASAVLTLELVGGPTKPRTSSECRERLEKLRTLLKKLALRLRGLTPREIEEARIQLDLGSDNEDPYAQEASRLADAATTVFQLDPEGERPKLLPKHVLYAHAQAHWESEAESSRGERWFERSRLKPLLLPKLAEWIVEYEEAYRNSQHSEIDSALEEPGSDVQRASENKVTPQDSQVKGGLLGDRKDGEVTATPSHAVEQHRLPSAASQPTAPSSERLNASTARPQRSDPSSSQTSRGMVRVLVWMMLFGLLAAGTLLLAGSPKDRSLEDARTLFKIDGNDAPKFGWQPEPPPKNPTDARGRNVAVFVCEQTVSTCTPGTPGVVRFSLTDIHHEDRGAGLDNWDFVFKPYQGDTPIRRQLQVVYRVNTEGAKVAALIVGDPGDDSLPENVVGQLNSFSSTSFAEDFLHKLRNEAGIQWAKQNGIRTSTNQTSLTDRASVVPLHPSTSPAPPPSTKFGDDAQETKLYEPSCGVLAAPGPAPGDAHPRLAFVDMAIGGRRIRQPPEDFPVGLTFSEVVKIRPLEVVQISAVVQNAGPAAVARNVQLRLAFPTHSSTAMSVTGVVEATNARPAKNYRSAGVVSLVSLTGKPFRLGNFRAVTMQRNERDDTVHWGRFEHFPSCAIESKRSDHSFEVAVPSPSTDGTLGVGLNDAYRVSMLADVLPGKATFRG